MISSPFILNLVQTTLAVSLLIGLVLLVRRPVSKAFGPQSAYALWAVPILRVILPPMPSHWTVFGFVKSAGVAPTPSHRIDDVSAMREFIVSHTDNLTFTGAPMPVPTGSLDLFSLLPSALVSLWFAGVICVLAMFGLRQRAFNRNIQNKGVVVSAQLRKMSQHLQATMKLNSQQINIRTSPACSGPMVAGLVRPTILIPTAFEDDYTEAEQRTALSHELMHIKRRDIWALHVAILIVAIQWFNPLVWLALKTFRTDQEAACDADVLALGHTCPHVYGATLLKTAKISRALHQPVLATSLPLNHALHERLNTMKNPVPTPRKRSIGSMLTATVGAALLFASASAVSAAQETEEPAATETIITQKSVESIFISDEDGEVTVIRNGEKLSPDEAKAFLGENGKVHGRIHFELDDELDELTAGNRFVFFKSDAGQPDSQAFASEMRRLAEDPVANADEIRALADDFEARMNEWNDTKTSILTSDDNFAWTSTVDGADCDGDVQVRTVIVKKADGSGTETVSENVGCGDRDIDIDALMEELRGNAALTEERLEEVRKRLEDVRNELAGQEFPDGTRRKRIRIETDD